MTKRKLDPGTIIAVFKRDVGALREALACGVGVDAVGRGRRTALHHATIDGDLELVKVLLEAGASPDAADATGWTPLHFAASGHHPAIVQTLLESGASVDPEDEYGNTPLWRAVFESRGRGEIIRVLRDYGADETHRNRHDVSPIELARRIANFDVLQWMT